MDRKGVRDRIEEYLHKYSKIFVVGDEHSNIRCFMDKMSKMPERNYLLLVSEGNQGAVGVQGERKVVVSQEEYRYLEELYYMYEFSDRIYLLTDNNRYARLENYMLSGILTQEEVFTALLGEER